MRNIVIVGTILVSFFLEVTLGNMAGIWNVRPAFTVFAAVFWFWRLPFGSRLILALFAGALLDSISAAPFGTHLATLGILAFLIELLQQTFSHTESLLAEGVSSSIALFSFYFIAFGIAALFSYLHDTAVPFGMTWIARVFLASFLWALALPLCYYFSRWFFRTMRITSI